MWILLMELWLCWYLIDMDIPLFQWYVPLWWNVGKPIDQLTSEQQTSHWYQQSPPTSCQWNSFFVPCIGNTTHMPVTVQHTVNTTHLITTALFILQLYCMFNHLGFVALYFVTTSKWFRLIDSFFSDFKSHIFIYKELLTYLFLYALIRWVLHHSSGWLGEG